MNSVMVGMFETQSAAQEARSQLLAAGYAANAVTLTDDVGAAASASSSTVSAAAPEKEGAIARFFHSIFGDDSDDRARYGDTYSEALRRGHYGVSVSTSSEDEAARAEKILNSCGAFDVDERSQQWRTEGWTGGSATPALVSGTGGPMASGQAMTEEGTRTINVVEEDLKVGKRMVARGGVRIFSRVVQVPVEESVTLRQEQVNVQRRDVERPATEADFAAFKEGSIEVREMGEEVVVSKDARVVGEVEVGKTVTQRDETVRDTVRKTEVDVQNLEADGLARKPGTLKKPV